MDIATTHPVIAEVVAGARTDAQESELRRLLGICEVLSFESGPDFDGAARVYRRCRSEGVTPRSLIDCMIASVAIRHETSVLAHDVDFARMAAVVGLQLDPASLR
jgi:hypothetical protein